MLENYAFLTNKIFSTKYKDNLNLNAQKYQTDVQASTEPGSAHPREPRRTMPLVIQPGPLRTCWQPTTLVLSTCMQNVNPIEHLWDLMKSHVHALPKQHSLAMLQRDINRVWADINQRDIQQYAGSIRFRCQVVIAANGGHTQY